MAKSPDLPEGPARRLKIEQNDPLEKNTAGEWIERWVGIIPTADGCVWAGVAEISGREFFAAAQVHADVDTRITIRSYAGKKITPDMRGVEVGGAGNGTVYHFRSVRWADDERSLLEIMATKVVTNPRT